MNNPAEPTPAKDDLIHGEPHAPLSAEAVAKALARHKREHPPEKSVPTKPKKHGR